MSNAQPSLDSHVETTQHGFLRKFLWTLLGLFITFIVIAVAFGQYSVHRSFPQTEGTIQIEALSGTAEVVRDSMGIPHIYADSSEDLMNGRASETVLQ